MEEIMWFYLSSGKILDGQVEEFPSNWKPCVILRVWITEQTDQGFVRSWNGNCKPWLMRCVEPELIR